MVYREHIPACPDKSIIILFIIISCLITCIVLFSACIGNELTYAENMEKLGSVALSREAETGIGKMYSHHF